MAYNLCDRLPPLPTNYRLLEPGSYQNDDSFEIKPNKAPFLSKSERVTTPSNRIWTHAIYHADPSRKIPNCTAMMSKRPRFPYEALSKEDLEAILCRCGLENVCECTEENEQDSEVNCHAKIHRRLFKGFAPKSAISDGLSIPSRRDHGFHELPDGTHRRTFNIEKDLGPPFYDVEVLEPTAFYQGWKWSQRTSTRSAKPPDKLPGPADYFLEKQPTHVERCAEKFRSHRRKHSKQLRYIEMTVHRNLREGLPGPSTYSPQYPKGTELEYLGPKDKRFHDSIEQRAGPADHWIKRDFDPPNLPNVLCQARLPEPSGFGGKDTRFKPRKEEGPSPASYDIINKRCHFMHCPTAVFGSSSPRFKDTPFDEDDEIEAEDSIKPEKCIQPTWEFKSKSIRIKPLLKMLFEQSPADLPMSNVHIKRSRLLQYISPFNSSEGRFQPWYNWLPILGKLATPGPGYYNLEKPKCQPAVAWGPLFRAKYSTKSNQNPAPNEYSVSNGIETILATHNERLKYNIKNQHKFHWKSPFDSKVLSLEEQELLILDKLIAVLDVNYKPSGSKQGSDGKTRSKNIQRT